MKLRSVHNTNIITVCEYNVNKMGKKNLALNRNLFKLDFLKERFSHFQIFRKMTKELYSPYIKMLNKHSPTQPTNKTNKQTKYFYILRLETKQHKFKIIYFTKVECKNDICSAIKSSKMKMKRTIR